MLPTARQRTWCGLVQGCLCAQFYPTRLQGGRWRLPTSRSSLFSSLKKSAACPIPFPCKGHCEGGTGSFCQEGHPCSLPESFLDKHVYEPRKRTYQQGLHLPACQHSKVCDTPGGKDHAFCSAYLASETGREVFIPAFPGDDLALSQLCLHGFQNSTVRGHR